MQNHFSEAIRELAAERDRLLHEKDLRISLERLQRLRLILASELPLETALRSIAKERDNMIDSREAWLSPRLHSELMARAVAPSRTGKKFYRFDWAVAPLRCSALRFGSLSGAVLAVVMCASVFLYFAHRERAVVTDGTIIDTLPHSGEVSTPAVYKSSLTGRGAHLFDAPTRQLTLHVSKMEIASFQPSLLAINNSLLNGTAHTDEALSLDLPTRKLMSDAEGVNNNE
jgi:hypothetical protein